ncbi:MAG: 3'(2'),5'-bisphosphate nucleotidase CysQ [Alphaproteobacteria bacterium]|nr:3'(2'),5'-bisphosphate nucleotidase CysQ [Alphaproteobacteria bacterium]
MSDLPDLSVLMHKLRPVAEAAGAITLKYFKKEGYEGADVKDDGSPVTKADQEAEAYIFPELAKLTPSIPMIGEESVAEGKIVDLAGHDTYYLVDPLDGTKEFISGSGDYTVNIALVHKGVPVMGLVYVPALDIGYMGYSAPDGRKEAFLWGKDVQDVQAIHVRTPPAEGLSVVASKSHGSGEVLDKFLESYKVAQLVKKGSSLKICAIASGEADLYPRFGPTCAWDTAAAHAVLLAAGGEIKKECRAPLRYKTDDPTFLNPFFIAGGFDW